MRIPRFILFLAVCFELTLNPVTASPEACDEFLIKGSPKEFTYSIETNLLTCKDRKEIALKGLRYPNLTCDKTRGWMDSKHHVIAGAAETITIACKIPACDERLVIGFDNATMEHVNREFKCRGKGQALRIATGEESVTKVLSCYDKGRWMAAAGKVTGINATDPITITECFETTCDEDKIRFGKGVGMTSGPPLTLRCLNVAEILIKDGKPYSELSCESQWENEKGVKVAEATASFAASCEEKACHPGLVTLIGGAERTLNEIKCSNVSDEIKIDSEYHSSLSCDKTSGWTNQYGTVIKTAELEFSAECVPKTCDRSLINASSEVHFEPGSPAKLNCSDKGKVLLIAGRFYNELSCEKGKSWMEGSSEVEGHSFTAECVEKACHPSLLRSISFDEVDISVPNKLSCKDAGSELRVKGTKFYGNELTCDKQRGWTADGSSTVVAQAESEIGVECVKKSCHESMINSTAGGKFKFEKDSIQADKFVLECADNNTFLYANNVFFSSLECVKGGEWTALGKPANETISIDCVAKACHDSFVVLGEGVRRTENTITCDNSTHRLHINDSSVYSDSLTCNATEGWFDEADPELNTIRGVEDRFSVECVEKDLPPPLNNETTIEKVTNCNETFDTLITNCNSTWKGCHEIVKESSEKYVCPAGMDMFYKRPSEASFNGYELRGSIRFTLHCEKKSKWIVKWTNMTMHVMREGDIIICAPNKPLTSRQVTTTTLSTTTTATEGTTTSPTTKKANRTQPLTSNTSPSNSTKDSADSYVLTAKISKRTIVIIASSIVAFLVLLAVGIVICIVAHTTKREPAERSDGESSLKLLEDKKIKRGGELGENDIILDEVSVEEPSEIKLR